MSDTHIPSLDEDSMGGASMTLTEIYEQLMATPELILTIPADEEDRLRKGLASVKAKANKKLVEAGMPVDKSTLSFTVIPHKDKDRQEVPGLIDIHIVMGKPNAITVLAINLPDSEF